MMNSFVNSIFGKDGHQYTLLGGLEKNPTRYCNKRITSVAVFLAAAITIGLLLGIGSSGSSSSYSSPPSPLRDGAPMDTCDTVFHGYQCSPRITRYWGQYSPYFSVHSQISPDVPEGCEITFAQVLMRHGARDPTAYKTQRYNATIAKLQRNVGGKFQGIYEFLNDYEYTLGADNLTTFGQQQLLNAGFSFYHRYHSLTRTVIPFVRASGQERVVDSAQKWVQGYRDARMDGGEADYGLGIDVDLVIEEGRGWNNTLSHSLCTAFENGTQYRNVGHEAQQKWVEVFLPSIQARLNRDMPGADLTYDEIVQVMDLCPFETVACNNEDRNCNEINRGHLSPFCNLFTETEWHQYAYLQSLGKYHGYGPGHPLGPTQGVGWANELIARMTGNPVRDHTSVNQTLDEKWPSPTFPKDRGLYADFTHDNDMMTIFSALGLYNNTTPLPSDRIVEGTDTEAAGFSAAWTVPFAARAYFEKMTCENSEGESGGDELVRVLVNDRVLPLKQCNADSLGRCTLPNFVNSLGFAKMGGHWEKCFE